jgi:ADP-heptose:LPS heptosyltransferase
LKTKSFNNTILITIPSLGIGDILCATPTIEAIRNDHPTAIIDVETRFPEVFVGNPNINNHIMYSRTKGDKYDRHVSLEPDFSLATPLHESYEKAGATTLKSVSPQLFLTEEEIAESTLLLKELKERHSKIIVCSMLMKRVEWQGRNWTINNATRFIEALKNRCSDCGIIEVGKETATTGIADLDLVNKTTLRQLFAIIAQADVFVGIDSLPFHIAQAFKINSVVLFGATKPESRIADSSFITPVVSRFVRCRGCYHVKHQSVFNKCDRGDEACMRTIMPDEVVEAVQNTIKKRII